GRLQIGMLAGMKSEWVAGFVSESMAGFIGIRIEVTQKLTQGMSGGPVFDDNDLVAGVIHKGGPDEGRDFAVHIDALTAWLDE
ncbi:hypothetical protein SAMN05892877_106341, partial [Rhizobium subbaraonis]